MGWVRVRKALPQQLLTGEAINIRIMHVRTYLSAVYYVRISESLCKSYEGGPSYGNYLQCNSFSQIHSSVTSEYNIGWSPLRNKWVIWQKKWLKIWRKTPRVHACYWLLQTYKEVCDEKKKKKWYT